MRGVLTSGLSLSKAEAARRVRAAEAVGPRTSMLGEVLEPVRPLLAVAQQAGEVSAEKVSIIASALKRVDRRGFTPADIATGEQLLTEQAAVFPPEDLKLLADKLIDAIDPDGTLPNDELNTDRPASGAVLDLGRTRRIASRPQTMALIARDGGCSFPGGNDAEPVLRGMNRNYLIYSRLSMAAKDPLTGLPDVENVAWQEDECRAQIEANGDHVVEPPIRENSKSAYVEWTRPKFNVMIDQAKANRTDVHGVVSYALDRLTRHPKEMEALIDLAQHHDFITKTLDGAFDLTTETGRHYARGAANNARLEVEKKSKRHRDANALRLTKGRPPSGGGRPFGFEADKVTIRPAEAALIKDVTERYLSPLCELDADSGCWLWTGPMRGEKPMKVHGAHSESSQTARSWVWREVLGRPAAAAVMTAAPTDV
jgi:DNA invertase Pin-like site-specific DNA recombinase